jgi:cytochrome b6-f complex iron-sulfur subunit
MLESSIPRERAQAIVAELAAKGLAAAVRDVESGTAVVVEEAPDGLEPPAGVARAVRVDLPERGVTRRALLEAFALALGAITVGGAALAAGAFASSQPQARPEGADEVEAASLAELKAKGSVRFRYGREPCIVLVEEGPSGGTVVALSLVCTHLGCLVEWNRETRLLECPCHRGAFDTQGRVRSGPPPKPLRQYDVEVRGDRVFVRHKRGA